MVVLQERNFSWPAGRRASQGTPEFFQEEKTGVGRFQCFLSYLSGFFIMAISISTLNSREREMLSLSPKASALQIFLKDSLEQSLPMLLLARHAECKMSVQNCLLTQHSMTSVDWNWSHYLQ